MSPNMFGRLAGAPWRKARIGGGIWYIDAQLTGFGLPVAADPMPANGARLLARSAA